MRSQTVSMPSECWRIDPVASSALMTADVEEMTQRGAWL